MSGTVVFEDAKLQAVELIAETVTLNNFSVSTATTFQQTTNASNVTTNTLRFTNPATAFVTTGNVEVGGELTVGSNVEVGGELTVGSNVEIGTANLFVDTTTSNVGIGTATADGLLHLFKLGTGANNVNEGAGIKMERYANYGCAIWNQFNVEEQMAFRCAHNSTDALYGTPQMVLTHGGKLGIGTASPLEKLDVYGTSRISSAYPRLDFFCTTGRSTNAWGNSTGAAGDYRIYSNGDASDGTKRSLNFDYGQNTTHTTRMCINADGNVGIAQSSPSTKLHVNGSGSSGTTVLIDGPTQGNSGGPNNDPWSALELRRLGTSGETYNGSVNLRAYRWETSGQNPAMALRFNLSSTAPYNTNDVMTLRSDGNVGIGTTSPRGKLDVYTGSTSTAGLIIDRYPSGTYRSELYQESNGLAIKCGDGSNAPAEIMRLTNSRVGIGTTSPAQKLEVNGVIKNKSPAWSVYKASTGGANSGILEYNSNRCTPVNVTLNTVVVGGLTYFYRATITIAGRYFVGFQGFADPGQNGTGHEIYIRLNGYNEVRNYMNAPTNNYNTHGGLGAVLDLAVNDYVEVYSGATMHHNANCSFYGFMIG